MFWPQNLLADPERFLKERFGFGVIARMIVQHGQVIEALGAVWVFWPQNLLADPERFLKEQFGFGVLVRIQVQHGQVIEALRRVWMFWPQNLLADPERFLKKRFGFGVVPDLREKEPEVIQRSGGLGVFRPTSALCHFNRSFRNGNSLLIFSLFNQLANLLMQCVRLIVFDRRCWTCEKQKAECEKEKR